ncbi:MAG: DUF3365 domain-containing protein [Elusimicrobia bacterium]|nr:DUF3365 domain-containing protein [Elusimicrobiota bacterium]
MKTLLAVIVLLAACAPRPARLVEAPGERARAFAAFDRLQQALGARLTQEMSQGPEAALAACRTEAPALAGRVRAEQGLALGRTSHRLRNPDNAAPRWAAPYLDAAAGRPAAEVRPVEVDLGGTVGVLRPIGVQPLCLRCHGDPAGMPDGLKARLKELYPKDAATGFTAGEFRGFFWAEVPKAR